MDLFGIGAGEILLILIIALIVWGPNKLPKIARTLGAVTRQLKKATSDFTASIAREADLEEKAQQTKATTPATPAAGKKPAPAGSSQIAATSQPSEKTGPSITAVVPMASPASEKPETKPDTDEQ